MQQPKGKGAWMAKVGEKGQIVIPKAARDMFGIEPGDTLLLMADIHQGIGIVSYDGYTHFAESVLQAKEAEDEENT